MTNLELFLQGYNIYGDRTTDTPMVVLQSSGTWSNMDTSSADHFLGAFQEAR